MAQLKLKTLTKSFGGMDVLKAIDLDIEAGEFVVFVGPSGCGKSTILRLIAGLEGASSGDIFIGDRLVNDIAPSKRGVAMVFQSYALYPHMNVYNNMAFGLKQAKLPKDEIDKRVREAARILDITSYLERLPKALSGGQRQRVAIGRAIVREPQIFLFDEPLSNLDAALRVQTRLEIARLHARLGTTMIYVTHDQTEAMVLADKIVVLRAGQIEQVGTPLTVYNCPANKFVAQFMGSPSMNLFQAQDLSSSASAHLGQKLRPGIVLGIRPEHLKLSSVSGALIAAHFELTEQLGEYVLVHLVTDSGTHFIAKLDKQPKAKKGDRLYFKAEAEFHHFFDTNKAGKRV